MIIDRDAELTDLVRGAIRAKLMDVHTALPAKVMTYDASKGQVEVQPLVKQRRRKKDGTWEAKDFPLVRGCMVMFPRCGKGYITFPIAEGDLGLIVFSERDLDEWVGANAGDIIDPGAGDTHSLMGGVFLPGLYPNTAVPSPTPSEDHVVIHVENELHLGEQGLSDNQFVAIAKLVKDELTAIKNAFSGHKHIYTEPLAAYAKPPTPPSETSAASTYNPGEVAAEKVKAK